MTIPIAFSERIARLRPSVVRDILAAAQSPSVISFAGGLPAPETLPRLAGIDVPTELGQYGPTEGEPDLRAAISRYLAGVGLECPAERVLVLSGSQQGIDLVAKLFIDAGTSVLVESPTYLAALQVFQLFGAALTGIETGPWGLDVTAFARAAARCTPRLCYLNPTFQNPTGAVYSGAVRADLATALDGLGLPLFEDDPYREVSFDGPAPSPIVARLKKVPWVYQSSFSKVFMPGIRLGFLAASEELFTRLSQLKQAADLHSNRVSQWLARTSLENPRRVEELDALRATYRSKRDAFDAALHRHLGGLAEWSRPSGGLFFWLRLRKPRELMSVLPRAIERGVAFVPGEPFFPEGTAPQGYMRLNFSRASIADMDEGLCRLAAVLRDG